MKQVLKSQEGFYLVALSLVLPIGITLLFFTGVQMSYIHIYERGKELCLEQLGKTQYQMSLDLKRIMGLNPGAKALRKKRKIAQRNLKKAISSKVPPAIAAAAAYFVSVVLQQFQYAAKQKSILLESQMKSLRNMQSMRAQFSQLYHRGLSQFSTSSAKLKLRKTPYTSITPDYNPAFHFTKVQAIQVNWSVSALDFSHSAIRSFFEWIQLRNFSPVYRNQCRVTLIKENNQWVVSAAAAGKPY